MKEEKSQETVLELFLMQPRSDSSQVPNRSNELKKKKKEVFLSVFHENAAFSWEGEDFICHCDHLPKELSCSLQYTKDSKPED